MAVPVGLSGIIDALEGQLEETLAFVDPETGQVHVLSIRVLSIAEEGDPEDLEDWEKHEFEIAQLKVETGRFLRLPSQRDVHEWSIMEEFALSVHKDSVREQLLSALHGRGAFRYFKDTWLRFKMQQAWYDYRTQALREIAVEWCRKNHIEFTEGKAMDRCRE